MCIQAVFCLSSVGFFGRIRLSYSCSLFFYFVVRLCRGERRWCRLGHHHFYRFIERRQFRHRSVQDFYEVPRCELHSGRGQRGDEFASGPIPWSMCFGVGILSILFLWFVVRSLFAVCCFLKLDSGVTTIFFPFLTNLSIYLAAARSAMRCLCTTGHVAAA